MTSLNKTKYPKHITPKRNSLNNSSRSQKLYEKTTNNSKKQTPIAKIKPIKEQPTIENNKTQEENKTNFLSDKPKIQKDITLIKNNIYQSEYLGVPLSNPQGENCCYINTIIQLISRIEKLKNLYISIGNTSNNSMLNSFSNLLKNLNEFDQKSGEALDSSIFRKELSLDSKKKFKWARDGDPAELLDYLLDSIVKEEGTEKQIKEFFSLEISEENECKKCKKIEVFKYNKQSYIYTSYINEIMNLINIFDETQFESFYNQFPKYTRNINLHHVKNCDQCATHPSMTKKIKCLGIPEFLIINCAWNQRKPDFKYIIQSYFLLPLKFKLKEFFDHCKSEADKLTYHMIGIILFSYYKHHYILIEFDEEYEVWIVKNDDLIYSYDSYDELIEKMIGRDGKNIYYPVIIIYQGFPGANSKEINNNKDIPKKKELYIELNKLIDKFKEKEKIKATQKDAKEKLDSNEFGFLDENEEKIKVKNSNNIKGKDDRNSRLVCSSQTHPLDDYNSLEDESNANKHESRSSSQKINNKNEIITSAGNSNSNNGTMIPLANQKKILKKKIIKVTK